MIVTRSFVQIRPLWYRLFHRSGCLYITIRGENVSFQSECPLNSRSFKNSCRCRWNYFTLTLLTISSGSRLYIHISPRALLRSISRKLLFLMSTICLPCLEHVLRVDRVRSSDAWKKAWKCSGPFPKAHLCIRPSMAISRLHLKGARLKWHSASASDIPSSDKNLSWEESNGAKTVLQAWYIAAVRYSRYEISWLL